MPHAAAVTPQARAAHQSWLMELGNTPTASGHEHRVAEFIERWVRERADLTLSRDGAGNLTVAFAHEKGAGPPVYFTAHMDHPAFVVERIVAPDQVEVSFRGGVLDPYFEAAEVRLIGRDGSSRGAILDGESPGAGGPLKHYAATVRGGTRGLEVGDLGVWALPPGEIREGLAHLAACDDLAAAAAALAALDELRSLPASDRPQIVRLLFTRAEEVGFVGAMAACRSGTIPPGARVIALENSRSFADSPIGGGPIVRVGDRISIFSPGLTASVARRAEEVVAASPGWKWQRKLMAGGACEASVFCAAGYEATCVCLPLGNYHNMADLDALQAGTLAGKPRVAREFISVADFDGLVDLLVACGVRLPATIPIADKFAKLWEERRFVLE
jgi:putative aminopeptidase FrvX